MPIIIRNEKPLPGEVLVPYEKPLVDAVESLIRYHRQKGGGSIISTESQWEVVEKIFEVWATLYPQEYKDFRKAQSIVKRNQKNTHAANEENGAKIQHLINIPVILHSLIRVLYPNQKFDKKFISKLAMRMPLLKMPDSNI